MVGDVRHHRDVQLRTFGEKRVESRVVGVESFRPGQLSAAEAHAFVR
jgi:hypothetical protein